jgi:hypothetical protein
MTRPNQQISDQQLVAHLEQELPQSEARQLEAALADSGSLQRRKLALEEIRQAVAAPCHDLERRDFVAALHDRRRARRDATSSQQRSWRPWLWSAAVGAACCVALAIVVPLQMDRAGPPHRQAAAHEFRPKSAAGRNAGRADWIKITAYRVDASGSARKLHAGASLPAGEGLLFSYTNLPGAAYKHLMIFGVDRAQRIHWFYPAYERIEQNPRSIAIRTGVDHELRDLVRHPFATGRLQIHGLFSDKPLSVKAVEKWIGQRGTKGPAKHPTFELAGVSGTRVRFDIMVAPARK